MTYEAGIYLKPFDPGYQIKLNDEISGNLPYRENVSILNSFGLFFLISRYCLCLLAQWGSRLFGWSK